MKSREVSEENGKHTILKMSLKAATVALKCRCSPAFEEMSSINAEMKELWAKSSVDSWC